MFLHQPPEWEFLWAIIVQHAAPEYFVDMNSRVKYWIELGDYDPGTARAVLEKGRYLHVGFMCHQAVEKILKATWRQKLGTVPPKTHSLAHLLDKTGLSSEIPAEMADFVDELEPLNIQARYPEYRDEVFRKMTEEYTKTILQNTEDLYTWIQSKL